MNNFYILTYKNQRISRNDFTPAYIMFNNDLNPILFINDNNTILPNLRTSNTITLSSNLSQGKILNIINSFFITKNIPFNASIKNSAKGIYNIKFNNSQLSSNFLKYYQNKIHNKPKYYNLKTERDIDNKSISSIIRINKKEKLPPLISLYNVIKENSKSDLMSRRIIESGYNFLRQLKIYKKDRIKSKKKDDKRKLYINEKYIDEDYEGMYLSPFMSGEEKYFREKFLDKKNWINKDGFIVSVGKYKMKDNNFIPNYVSATPSEPPLNHRYRDIDKNKWINKNGFIL